MYDTVIIDGNHLAHRARHTFINLSYRGKDVGTIYGVMRLLTSILNKYKPNSMIVAWDGGIPNFRRKFLPNYKANRKHDDDDKYKEFVEQLKELSSILPKCGVVQLRRLGIEGDDLAHHASRLLPVTEKALIVSGDDDLLQAVNDCTHVLQPGKTELLVTLDNFEEVVGIRNMDILPQSYTVMRALSGDSSDNITGIVGIGHKTAAKIVNDGCRITWRTKQCTQGLLDGVEFIEPHGYEESKWAAKLDMFIQSGLYERTYKTIDLTLDRTGARWEAIHSKWQQCNVQAINGWLTRWGFSSLITMGTAQAFAKLQQPHIYATENMKVPMIWDTLRCPIM